MVVDHERKTSCMAPGMRSMNCPPVQLQGLDSRSALLKSEEAAAARFAADVQATRDRVGSLHSQLKREVSLPSQ